MPPLKRPTKPWITERPMAITARYQDHVFIPSRPMPTAIWTAAAKMPRKPDHMPELAAELTASAPNRPLTAEVRPPMPKTNPLQSSEKTPMRIKKRGTKHLMSIIQKKIRNNMSRFFSVYALYLILNADDSVKKR